MKEADIIYSMSNEEYHQQVEWLSKSGADLINRAPALFYDQIIQGNKGNPTKALIDGRRAHTYILEPEKRDQEFVILDEGFNGRTKDGKAFMAKIQEEGKEPIPYSDHLILEGMKGAVESHPIFQFIMDGAIIEASIFWRDFESGVQCRCRPDILNSGKKAVADVKTSTNASLEEFRRSIAKFRYHCQAGHYLSGVRTQFQEVERFLFIVVEKAPPHLVAIYELDPLGVVKGYNDIQMNYRKYLACLEAGEWPGYPEEVYMIDVPTWA